MRSAYKVSFLSLVFLCLTAQAQQGNQTNPHTQIRWPNNCNNDPHMAYNWQLNLCVHVGPVGNTGEVQVNQGGTWYSVPGFKYDFNTNTLTAPNINVPGTSNVLVPPTNVTWPGSCTSGVYSPASNICVAPGTAANPAAPSGSGQMNAGGTFAPIPGFMSDATNGWITAGGTTYAKGKQTGAGGNGIANGQAPYATLESGPDYISGATPPAILETPTIATFTASPMHWHGKEVTQDIDFYRNPGMSVTGAPTYANRFGLIGEWGRNITCQFDMPMTGSGGNTRPGCMGFTLNELSPGWNESGVTSGGWWVGTLFRMNHITYSSGISEIMPISQFKNSTGDNIGIEGYLYHQGGWVDGSGEATKMYGGGVIEQSNAYAGTATTASSTNPTLLTTTPSPTYGTGFSAVPLQGNGRYVIRRGACSPYPTSCPVPPFGGTGGVPQTYAGTASTVAVGIDSQRTSAVTISDTVPVSNAYGSLTADCNTAIANVNPPFTNSATCNIGSVTGTLNTTSIICFDGWFHECAYPSAVSGTQITFNVVGGVGGLRHIHGNGTMWFQGGMAGYGLEWAATTQTVQSSQPLRLLFDVFGSTGPNTLQVGGFLHGGNFALSTTQYTQYFNMATTLSSQGTTIYLTFATGGTGAFGSFSAVDQYPNAAIAIENADDSALNGFCTNLTWLPGSQNGTCIHAGLTGTHTNTSATPRGRIANNGVGWNAYILWPMAEVTDVRNTTVNPPVVDGTFALEQNLLGAISSGDYLEETHHISQESQGANVGVFSYNPNALTHVLAGSIQGLGACCGTQSGGSNSMMFLANLNPDSMYGMITPPNGGNITGAIQNGLLFDHAATNGGAILYVTPRAYQTNDPALQYEMLLGIHRSGSLQLIDFPYYGDATLTTSRLLNLVGVPVNISGDIGPATFRGNVILSTPAAPTLTVVPSTTGGTLADGTYYYKVQSRGTVNSPLSTEQTCTISGGGGFGSCVLSWTVVAGATQYIPSGRATTGGEANFATIFGQTATNWIDTGTQTPSGAAFAATEPLLQLGSLNSVFIDSLQASTGNTANVTHTLPSYSGTVSVVSTLNAGLATLAAGTVTVNTTQACTAAAACVYSFTNCGPAGSAIGVPSLGTVTVGTSFVINSISAANAVTTGDTSKVCWRIN